MKVSKLILVAGVVLFGSQAAIAEVPGCAFADLEPYIIRQAKENLSKINPDLDLSTVEIKKLGIRSFYNIDHVEFSVTVRDKSGLKYTLSTYKADRKSGKLKDKVGGLIVSKTIFVKSDAPQTFPHRCESQYLSFTSLWINNDTIYATRLVDQNGKVVDLNKDKDLFDRMLRAAAEDIGSGSNVGSSAAPEESTAQPAQ